MVPSDVCPTEDAVKAFIEHLVDPLLPAKSSVHDNPSPSQQKLVARQLIVVLRPALLAFMQFMQNSNEEELTDVEKQLSLTEKMIMEACDVCKCLDASKNVPNIEGWPITKVAILLIDSKKENCFLLFSSITSGVWSLVEKGLGTSSQSSPGSKGLETSSQSSLGSKGINYTDISLLESDTVYSESKEKEASRFYIMQCSKTINEEVIQVPLQDLIKSLQGPLLTKSFGSWMITPVIDYFHVLPYYETISKWISRKAFSNTLQDTRVTEKNIKVDTPEVTEFYVNEDMFTAHDSKPKIDNIDSPKQKENNRSCTPALSDSICEPMEMTMNENSILKSKIKEKCQYIIGSTVQAGEDLEKKNPSVKYNSIGSASAEKALNVDSTNMLITEGGINNLASLRNMYAIRPNMSSEKGTVDGHIQIANHSDSDLEKLKVISDSKKILTQTALAALIRKRDELALQQRKIEDEIAVCDKNIQRILTDGEDNFGLKIESVIGGCNDTWLRNQERVYRQPSSPLKRKKLSEAVFITQSPCQELDDICRANNWVLPIYHLSQSEGGFKASVTVRGVEFQCSFEGKTDSNPSEARDSAAVQMLTNLRSMAKSEQ
ncbi:hypothetical protein ACSQ67_022408 [Phaseolus vulgaris]